MDSENKEKLKEHQEVEKIVEQLHSAETTISIKPHDKSRKQAQDKTPESEKETIPPNEEIIPPESIEKETVPPEKNDPSYGIKETEQYYIPGKKKKTGMLVFLLVLLIVSITIAVLTFKNNPPKADSTQVDVPEDSPTAITLMAKDKDGDPLTYKIVTNPRHGLLSGNAPDLIYTPDKDYTGPDGLSFIVSDGKIDSNSAAVSITVTPVNDPPVADSQNLSLKVDKSLPITLKGNDSDSEKITFSIRTDPTYGSISKMPGFETNGSIIYTPKSGYTGSDSFTFVTNDGESNSKPATVQINVTQNNPPVAEIESVNTVETFR